MRAVGWLLAGGLLIAVMRAALTVLLAALMMAIAVSLIRAPVKTLTVMFGLAMLHAFTVHPAAGFAVMGVILAGGILSANR